MRKKNKKGSVLVFSLIVMSIMLTAALSVATVAVTERRTSAGTEDSNQAFQIANSAVEMVIYEKEKEKESNPSGDISSLSSGSSLVNCEDGVIKSDDFLGGTMRMEFYNGSDDKIGDCDALISSIKRVKSIGTFKNAVRAVDVELGDGT